MRVIVCVQLFRSVDIRSRDVCIVYCDCRHKLCEWGCGHFWDNDTNIFQPRPQCRDFRPLLRYGGCDAGQSLGRRRGMFSWDMLAIYTRSVRHAEERGKIKNGRRWISEVEMRAKSSSKMANCAPQRVIGCHQIAIEAGCSKYCSRRRVELQWLAV